MKRKIALILFVIFSILATVFFKKIFFTKKITNAAGNIICFPKQVFQPINLEELCTIIKKLNGQKVRAIASRHSWNNFICSENLIDTSKLNKIIFLDKKNYFVTVQAGVNLKKLSDYLQANGLSMPYISNISGRPQTIGGAVSTSTHGSCHYGTMSNNITSIQIVDANGNLITFNENDEDFKAAIVSIGCMGIIYSVTLKCFDDYETIFYQYQANIDDLLDTYLQIFKNTDSVTIRYNPMSKQVLIYILTNNENFKLPDQFEFKFKQKGKISELVNFPYSKNIVVRRIVEKKDVQRIEAEAALPIKKLKEAIVAIEKLKTKFSLNYWILFRFVSLDSNSYLSTAIDRDTMYISFNSDIDQNYKFELTEFTNIMLSLGGRAHWGKFMSLTKNDLKKLYKNFDKFVQTRQKFDPNKIFLNKELEELFG